MAVLRGWYIDHKEKWFSVSPFVPTMNDAGNVHKVQSFPEGYRNVRRVVPTVSGETDLYRVEFYPDEEGKTFSLVGSVAGWQTGHAALRLLAEVYCHIDEVMEITSYRKGERIAGGRVIWENACWLEARVNCVRPKGHPERVVTAVYALDQAYLQTTGKWRLAAFGLWSTPEAAREFGESLMGEVEQAEKASDATEEER